MVHTLLCTCMLSHFNRVQLFVTPWTIAYHASLSMGFSRQEYWSGLPCPPPGDLPDPGIKPTSLTSPALACWFFTSWGKATLYYGWHEVPCSWILYAFQAGVINSQWISKSPFLPETWVPLGIASLFHINWVFLGCLLLLRQNRIMAQFDFLGLPWQGPEAYSRPVCVQVTLPSATACLGDSPSVVWREAPCVGGRLHKRLP